MGLPRGLCSDCHRTSWVALLSKVQRFDIWAKLCDRSEDTFELREWEVFGALGLTWVFVLFLDLCWVQVNDAEEAYKILVFGKKNQSFSATRLNHLSSRR